MTRLAVALSLVVSLTGCVLFFDTDVPRPPTDVETDGVDDVTSDSPFDTPDDLVDITTDSEVDTVEDDASDTASDGVDEPDAEADGDAIEDVSDSGEPDSTEDAEPCVETLPFEACGDCIDNNCDGRVDEDECHEGRLVTVTSGAATAPARYSVSTTFDHATLVSADESRSDGDDVRVWFLGESGTVEIDRVLDPESSWNDVETTLWFALVEPTTASSVVERYVFEFGTEALTGMSDEGVVFHFADFFDRGSTADPGNGWVIERGSGDVELAGDALVFSALNDEDNRPSADRVFEAISEKLSWRFGFDWERTGRENTYRFHFQLGSSATMDVPPPSDDVFSNAGVGPSLVWSGPSQGMTDHEGFGYEVAQVLTQTAVVSGATDIEARIDVAGNSYDLLLDGVEAAAGVPFTSARNQLDRLRFMAWQITQSNFVSARAFDYVIVRRLVDPEPVATVGALPSACP